MRQKTPSTNVLPQVPPPEHRPDQAQPHDVRWQAWPWLPLALLLFALALRCYGLTTPLLDYHSWRQTDTAAIARNFAVHGYRLAFPEVDWGGRLPGYVESEFPLYTYSLALLYGLFGIQEWVGRLLTALCSAGAVVALYALARPALGRRGAVYAGLTLALMPFALFFGRTVMPDSLMLLTGILTLLSLRAWLERPTPARLLAALFCGALAPLAKTPNLLILAPPLLALVLAYRPRHWPTLLLYGGCFGLPVLLWTLHARNVPLDPRLSFGIGEKLLDTRLLTDPQFYLLLARWSVENVLTWAGLPLLLLGLLSEPGSKPHGFSFLPWAWLLGVLLFLVVGAAGVVGQDYYILPLAGPLAWFVGAGVDRVQRWVAARMSSAALVWAVPVLTLGLLGGLSLARVAPLYRSADFYQTLGQRVDLALPPGEPVGVIAPAVSEILYYADRRGWRLDPGVIVPGGLASLGPDLGVRYLLIADPWLTERRDVLLAALSEFRRVPVGPYALLLDLARPGLVPPFELPPETGHLVSEPFLSAWRAAGAQERLGFPISDALEQPEGRVQFFERGLLVQQGDSAGPAPVGRLLLQALGLPVQPRAPTGAFRDAWERAGGAAVLGEPLSPPLEQNGRLVQFFAYGTLEADPGGLPSLGGAGRRLLDVRGLSEERQIELAHHM